MAVMRAAYVVASAEPCQLLATFLIIWLALGAMAAWHEIQRLDRLRLSDWLTLALLLLGGPAALAAHSLLYRRP